MLQKGTTLAGYRIDGVLGQGGMGTVYEANQLSLDRVVALKLLAAHLSDDIQFRERFRREGQIQARLEHPHIVTVYEAGETEHGLFIAMRLVRGRTLKDLINARELDVDRTLKILAPVAEALDEAHGIGLIHRDIKPQNVLVGRRDHSFLADFGLTKGTTETSLTKTGHFVGTWDYIPPEQINGLRATAASDIYSLAAVLYECLTGQVPYPKAGRGGGPVRARFRSAAAPDRAQARAARAARRDRRPRHGQGPGRAPLVRGRADRGGARRVRRRPAGGGAGAARRDPGTSRPAGPGRADRPGADRAPGAHAAPSRSRPGHRAARAAGTARPATAAGAAQSGRAPCAGGGWAARRDRRRLPDRTRLLRRRSDGRRRAGGLGR